MTSEPAPSCGLWKLPDSTRESDSKRQCMDVVPRSMPREPCGQPPGSASGMTAGGVRAASTDDPGSGWRTQESLQPRSRRSDAMRCRSTGNGSGASERKRTWHNPHRPAPEQSGRAEKAPARYRCWARVNPLRMGDMTCPTPPLGMIENVFMAGSQDAFSPGKAQAVSLSGRILNKYIFLSQANKNATKLCHFIQGI